MNQNLFLKNREIINKTKHLLYFAGISNTEGPSGLFLASTLCCWYQEMLFLVVCSSQLRWKFKACVMITSDKDCSSCQTFCVANSTIGTWWWRASKQGFSPPPLSPLTSPLQAEMQRVTECLLTLLRTLDKHGLYL